MSVVTNKLAEARYYLARMRHESATYVARDGAALTRLWFSISAFVTAARSTTFVMQKSFSAHPGFALWYANVQAILKKDDTAIMILNLRNTMQKHGNSWPRLCLNFNVANGNVVHFEADLSAPRGKMITKEWITYAQENRPKLLFNAEGVIGPGEIVEAIKSNPNAQASDVKELTWDTLIGWDVRIEENATPIPAIEFLEQCDAYIERLARVVADADTRFEVGAT